MYILRVFDFHNSCDIAVNRRLDEWIKLDQLDLDSVECALDEKVEDKVAILQILELFLFSVFHTESD